MPYYSGKALVLEQKAYNLKRTKKMLEEAEWMPYCSMKFEIFNQCEILIKSIEDNIKNLHKEWIEESGENPRTHLDRHLMKRQEKFPLLLDCNMDSFILNLCRECDSWINLRFHIPIQMTVIHIKKDMIFHTYESILTVIHTYNKIIEGWLIAHNCFFSNYDNSLTYRIGFCKFFDWLIYTYNIYFD